MKLEIEDTNTGDYGRPFGTYALIVKAAARKAFFEQNGVEPTTWELDRAYMTHMQTLPTYAEISKKIRMAEATPGAAEVDFTEVELRTIFERFAMANDPDSQRIAMKVRVLLGMLGQ